MLSFCFAVQCICQHHIHIASNGGANNCCVSRQHTGCGESKERPGHALVGEVQNFQGW